MGVASVSATCMAMACGQTAGQEELMEQAPGTRRWVPGKLSGATHLHSQCLLQEARACGISYQQLRARLNRHPQGIG